MGLEEDRNILGIFLNSVHCGFQQACTYNETGEVTGWFVLQILKRLVSFVFFLIGKLMSFVKGSASNEASFSVFSV